MQVEEETLSHLCADSSDNDEINNYLHSIIEEILFDEAIEFMWLIRSGQLSLEDLYNVQSFAEPSPPQTKIESILKKTQITGSAGGISSSSSNWMNRTVVCPLCKESVAGVRYAPHLERCMNGGKRGVRRHYDFLHDNAVSLPYYSSKPKQKKEFVDPYPDSLVIRVRVKNGGNCSMLSKLHIVVFTKPFYLFFSFNLVIIFIFCLV
jgi:hypothetical protein